MRRLLVNYNDKIGRKDAFPRPIEELLFVRNGLDLVLFAFEDSHNVVITFGFEDSQSIPIRY